LRELRERGYAGWYTRVTDYLRTIRPPRTRGYEHRFETLPGQQAQVDFAYFKVIFTDEPTQVRGVWLFSIVLGYSRYLYTYFVPRQDLPTLVRCHLAAFTDFGGVPRELLYDRMKTAVLGEEPPGQVIYHPTLLEVARHYGFTPRACAPYRAKTKGKVERPFRYVRQDFFLGRTFRNLEDLNHQLAEWRTGVANRRRHGTTQRLIPEALAEERAALHAVLKLEWRISRDGLVCVGGNQYSVPDTTRCRVVEVQTRATEVHIYEQGRLVAVHPLLEGRGQRRIAPGPRRYPPPATAQRRAAPEPPPLEIPGEQVACRTLEVYETIATALARQTERGG
jgi:transposase